MPVTDFLRGVWSVWRRHADVLVVNWKTSLVAPVSEPLLYLAAFGAGVGIFVRDIEYRGEVVSYAAFIAPGILASGLMFHTFFENTYGTFVRYHFQKTFDAILTTPVGLADLIVGELVWGATKGTIAVTVMMVVVGAFGLLTWPAAIAILPFVPLAGFMFASIACIFAATARRIDTLNYPSFLIVTPMFLFSGVFFPLDVLPPWARTLSRFLPLTHVVDYMREVALGGGGASLLLNVLAVIAFTGPAFWIAARLMRRRIVR